MLGEGGTKKREREKVNVWGSRIKFAISKGIFYKDSHVEVSESVGLFQQNYFRHKFSGINI
jgi:hypothetical protein